MSFTGIRKIHKATVCAMAITGYPLVPFESFSKIYYVLSSLCPDKGELVLIDARHSPIYVPSAKAAEMVALGLLVEQPDNQLLLTPHGEEIARQYQGDGYSYWDGHYDERHTGVRRFNWQQYFKTGCFDCTI